MFMIRTNCVCQWYLLQKIVDIGIMILDLMHMNFYYLLKLFFNNIANSRSKFKYLIY